MASKVCSKGEQRKGKHKWTFVKNVGKSTITSGPNGSRGTFSVVALYTCECGESRTGAMKHDAPGNDLRAHFPHLPA